MRLQLIVLDDVTSQEAIEVLRGCGIVARAPECDPPSIGLSDGPLDQPVGVTKYPSVRVLDAEGRPIPGARCNFDVKWSRLGEPLPTEPPGVIRIERPSAVKGDRSAEIERRLRAGEAVPSIAKAVGLTESAIYLRRKKLGITPDPKAKAKGRAAKGKVVRIRCPNCTRLGQDPKRCEHCLERR